jgi:tripartite-type tricarboxylate transporter receptor subunit TctC
MAGRLDAASVGALAILPYMKAGKVRCIATGSTRRLPPLPDVPTVAEQGFPGFEMTQWYGMLAPATMAQANVDRLTAETMKAMKAPAALERLAQDAAEPWAERQRSSRSSSCRNRSAGRRWSSGPGSSRIDRLIEDN